ENRRELSRGTGDRTARSRGNARAVRGRSRRRYDPGCGNLFACSPVHRVRRRKARAGQEMIAAALLLAAQTATAPPSLATVLQRAGEYVTEFHRRLSRIVAEERYVQKWET